MGNEATRFPVNRQNHTKKHPEGYFKPLYKKILRMEIPFDDPATKKKIKIPVALALLYRKIWNGLEGNGKDIEDILDRIDGKSIQTIINEGDTDKHIIIIRNAESTKEEQPANPRDISQLQTR